MGIALKILLFGLGLFFLYWVFLQWLNPPSKIGMGGVIFVMPFLLLGYCFPILYLVGFFTDLDNRNLNSIVKIVEGLIGLLLFFLWFVNFYGKKYG